MAKNEVAAAKNTQVADQVDYGDYAGMGVEDIDKTTLTIPVLKLLQNNSPEVEAEMEGARAGRTLNTVTGEFIDNFIFQPCAEVHLWQEWVPRTAGGGLVTSHDPSSDLIRQIIQNNGGSKIPPKGQDGKRIPFTSPDGNELVETFYLYGQVLDEEGNEAMSFGVIPFSGTKVSVRSKFMTSVAMTKGKPPLFAFRAKFKVVSDKNNAGQAFKNYAIVAPFGDPDPSWRASLIPPSYTDLLDSGAELMKMVRSGEAVAEGDDMVAPSESSGAGTDDIPF